MNGEINLYLLLVSVSDPFHFDTDPQIRFRWLRIRIRGNFNSLNLVFNCFVKFRIHINYTYYYIFRNVTKKSRLLTKKIKILKARYFFIMYLRTILIFFYMVLVSFWRYTRIRIRIVWNGSGSDQMIRIRFRIWIRNTACSFVDVFILLIVFSDFWSPLN